MDEALEGFPGVLAQGRKVAEADGMEIQGKELFQGTHGLFRRLGDAGGGGIEPPAELVLQGVADDYYALFGQVKGDTAYGVAGEMDDAQLGREGDDVSVFEAKVDGYGAACESGKGGSGYGGQELGPEGVWRRGLAFDNVRFGAVDGDGDTGFGDKFGEAA